MTELHASAKFPILYKTNDLAHPVKRFFNDAWNGKFFLESKVPKPAGSRGSRILSNIPHRFRILEKRYAKKNLPNSSAWVVATKMFAAVRLSLLTKRWNVCYSTTCINRINVRCQEWAPEWQWWVREKTPNQTRLGRRRRRFVLCFTLKIPSETNSWNRVFEQTNQKNRLRRPKK